MLYIPKLTDREIAENHKVYSERKALYEKKGLNSEKNRRIILKKAHPMKGSMLEIGTGTGHTVLSLAKAGYSFTSVDTDEKALKTAALNAAYEKVLSSVTFYRMDGKQLDFQDSSFNNVICVSLFHHIHGINRMLSETNRVLTPGGKAVLADFNEKGMAIINAVHAEEGRVHENSGVSADQVYSYFCKLGYGIEKHNDSCYWALIAEKPVMKGIKR